ncbi:hypothetical protein OY671_008822, partial [Metschnikowia pulcherrima]
PAGLGYALDTTGIARVIEGAFDSLAPKGKSAMVGASGPEATLAFNETAFMGQGRTVMGVSGGDSDIGPFSRESIDLHVAGRFPFERSIGYFDFDAIDAAVHASETGSVVKPLRIFVAVAETSNMRAAAERSHSTQPAVSAAIAASEERHATRSFDRVGRGSESNDAGRAFSPEARAVSAQAADASGVSDDSAGSKRGDSRIAASQTVATYWSPCRMAAFAAAHPGVTSH